MVTLDATCITSFNNGVLAAHNKYRSMHSTPAMKTNTTVVAIAQKFANYLAINNLFQHSQTSGLGENIAYTWSSSTPNLSNCYSKHK